VPSAAAPGPPSRARLAARLPPSAPPAPRLAPAPWPGAVCASIVQESSAVSVQGRDRFLRVQPTHTGTSLARPGAAGRGSQSHTRRPEPAQPKGPQEARSTRDMVGGHAGARAAARGSAAELVPGRSVRSLSITIVVLPVRAARGPALYAE